MKATLVVFSSLVAGYTARYFPSLDSIDERSPQYASLSCHISIFSFLPGPFKIRAYLELTTAGRRWTLAFQSEFLISPQAWR
jgi:hypothetical protein